LLPQRSSYDTWSESIDGDPLAGQRSRASVSERDDGEFAGTIGSPVGVTGAARNRGRIDDLAFGSRGNHRLGGFLDADHHPKGVHIHDLVPDCLACLEERFRLVEAGVVDHHLD
jgi:hypothetical protein